MKTSFLFTLVFIVLASCSKSDDNSSASYRSTPDYDISIDGRTLIKWKNPNTTELDMQADSELKRINTIAKEAFKEHQNLQSITCLLYTSPSPRDLSTSRMPSSA